MPHTSSAEKSLRQDVKRRLRNREAKKALKVSIKQFTAVLKTGTVEEVQAAYNQCSKLLDKAGIRRIVHPNMAARKKSQLAKKLFVKKNPPPAVAKA